MPCTPRSKSMTQLARLRLGGGAMNPLAIRTGPKYSLQQMADAMGCSRTMAWAIEQGAADEPRAEYVAGLVSLFTRWSWLPEIDGDPQRRITKADVLQALKSDRMATPTTHAA